MRRLILIPLILTGCATLDQKVQRLTTSELCFVRAETGLATERAAASNELARRNAVCTDEMAVRGAELFTQRVARQKQESAAWAAAGAALYAGSTPQAQSPQSYTQTYYLNGRYVTCSTLGAITTCR